MVEQLSMKQGTVDGDSWQKYMHTATAQSVKRALVHSTLLTAIQARKALIVSVVLAHPKFFKAVRLTHELKAQLLWAAVTRGCSATANAILNHKDVMVDISIPLQGGSTPLHIASYRGEVEMVKVLLSKGASLTYRNAKGWTPLHSAVRGGHRITAECLIANGAVVAGETRHGQTALHLACRHADAAMVTLLLDNGARGDINARLSKDVHQTPVHVAALHGHLDSLLVLHAAGADVQATTKYGGTINHMMGRQHTWWLLGVLELKPNTHVDSRWLATWADSRYVLNELLFALFWSGGE